MEDVALLQCIYNITITIFGTIVDINTIYQETMKDAAILQYTCSITNTIIVGCIITTTIVGIYKYDI